MAPDEWTPLSCGFWRDSKVVGTTPAAKLLVLSSYTYAQANLTDGVVPRGALSIIAADAGVNASRKVVAELEQRGLWEPCAVGWRIPGWTRWNKPAEVVKAIREAKATAGLAGNHKRWHVNEGVKVLGCPLCYPNAIAGAIPSAIAPAIEGGGRNGGETRYETVTNGEGKNEILSPDSVRFSPDDTTIQPVGNPVDRHKPAGHSVSGDRTCDPSAIGAANPIGSSADHPEESPPSPTPTPTATSRSASVTGRTPHDDNDEVAQRIGPDHPAAQLARAAMRESLARAVGAEDAPDDEDEADVIPLRPDDEDGPWPL